MEYEYRAEKIVQRRVYRGRTEYMIKWKGRPSSQNTWEPAHTLEGCDDLIRDLESRESAKHRQKDSKRLGAVKCKEKATNLEEMVPVPLPDFEKLAKDRVSLVNEMHKLFSSMHAAGNSVSAPRNEDYCSGRDCENSGGKRSAPIDGHSDIEKDGGNTEREKKTGNERKARGEKDGRVGHGETAKSEKGRRRGRDVAATRDNANAENQISQKKKKEHNGENKEVRHINIGGQKFRGKLLGVRRGKAGGFEYTIECERKGRVPMLFTVSAKDLTSGIPGTIIRFFEEHCSFPQPDPAQQQTASINAEISSMLGMMLDSALESKSVAATENAGTGRRLWPEFARGQSAPRLPRSFLVVT